MTTEPEFQEPTTGEPMEPAPAADEAKDAEDTNENAADDDSGN